MTLRLCKLFICVILFLVFFLFYNDYQITLLFNPVRYFQPNNKSKSFLTITEENEEEEGETFLQMPNNTFINLAIRSYNNNSLWPSSYGIFSNKKRLPDQIKYVEYLQQSKISSKLPTKLIYFNFTNSNLLNFFQFQQYETSLVRKSERCPLLLCKITRNSKYIKSADAIIQPVANFYPEPLILGNNNNKNQIWILANMEPPTIVQFRNHSREDEMNRIWTATYRSDSDLPIPYGAWEYYNDSITQIKQEINYADGKEHLVAAFITNCKSRNARQAILKQLSKRISIHYFGPCNFGGVEQKCARGVPECFLRVAKSYKFIIAIENSNCKSYITEKFFFNAMRHNAIPIVFGPDKEDYIQSAPENSFIHVSDFTSSEKLAKYLKYLDNNDEEYNKYFQWKGTGQFYSPIETFFCRICALLYYNDKYPKTTSTFSQLTLFQWWNYYYNEDEGILKPVCRDSSKVPWID